MYDLLALYAKPLCRREPVICIDEKSLQLIGHKRTIEWNFTRQEADRKLGSHYVSNFSC
ncbi:MAG: hypothetical protein GZ085_09425 [Sulfuriferula multivorans]|uniref:Uncharacterized protein n=1 Tax=Sulfuriferula multivorans TaxID=1559896 RepID=A0A7C9P8I5_9PROT|nr:hypothetical protein [Sulfuriferula multivorans]